MVRFYKSALLWHHITHGFADGIPYYLEKIKLPFWNYLDEEIERVDSFLRYEVVF